MDPDIAELEGLMDVWMTRTGGECEAEARSDDLSTYVIQKISGKPLRLPQKSYQLRGQKARSQMVYGYHEPTALPSVAARRFDRRRVFPDPEPAVHPRQAWDGSPPGKYWPDSSPRRGDFSSPGAQRKPNRRESLPVRFRQMLYRQSQNLYHRTPRKVPPMVKQTPRQQQSFAFESPTAGSRRELAILTEENKSLLEQVCQERASKDAALKRAATANARLFDLAEKVEETRNGIKEMEQSANKAARQQQLRNELLCSVKTRERRIKEIRSAIALATRRLEILEQQEPKEAALGTALTAPPAPGEFRDAANRNAELRSEYNALTQRRNELVTQLHRASVQLKDHSRKRDAIVTRMEREKLLVKLELERRLKKELEVSVAKQKDNNEKASRFRQRELIQKEVAANEAVKQLQSRLAASNAHSDEQTKELAQLKIQAAGLKRAVAELEKSVATAESQATKLRNEIRASEKELCSVSKTLAGAETQLNVLSHDMPAKELETVEKEHDLIRQKLGEQAASLQLQVNKLLEGRRKYEESAAMKEESFVRVAQLEGGISNLENEIRKVEETMESLKTDILKGEKELEKFGETLKQESVQKDSEIEHWTKKKEAASRKYKEVNSENTKMLVQLDLAERMIAMNNLTA